MQYNKQTFAVALVAGVLAGVVISFAGGVSANALGVTDAQLNSTNDSRFGRGGFMHNKSFSQDWDNLTYGEWQERVANTPILEKIDTEEKFNTMQEAHKLMSEGKFEEARTIMQDAGIAPERGFGCHGFQGKRPAQAQVNNTAQTAEQL